MNKIKRLVIECSKCGHRLFDETNVAVSGDNLLVLVKPCACDAEQIESGRTQRALDSAYAVCPHRAHVNYPSLGDVVECEFTPSQ